jgi:NAD(P)-dependent dehydrogenase (short-subunit alcohol dehydrogenase family)
VTQTANEVTELGGKGIGVALDHHDDAAVEALFARVKDEQGRLDILVNNAFFVPDALLLGVPFWEMPISLWDDMTAVGVRSSYVASVYAAPLMVGQRSGLIVNTSSPGGGHYTLTPTYGVGKVAVDRMAFDMAHELRQHNVAAVSIWLGLISTERTEVAAKTFEQFDISTAESPRFVGRGVAALAADPDIMSLSGEVMYSAELPERYGFTDLDGSLPPKLRSTWGDPPRFSVA